MQKFKDFGDTRVFIGIIKIFQGFGIMLNCDNVYAATEIKFSFHIRFLWLLFFVTKYQSKK